DPTLYHQLSTPQHAWGVRVLERLALAGGETVLDVGCGTGLVTAVLRERLPRGRGGALDLANAMAREARATRPAGGVLVVRADALALPLGAAVDAIFSTATLHWVLDQDRLVGELFAALRPGGRLVAQMGGGPNVRALHERAHALMRSETYAEWYRDW